MTELSTRGERSPVPAEWTYAPAPGVARDRRGCRSATACSSAASGSSRGAASSSRRSRPSDEEPLAEVAQAGPEDVALAVAAAREAFAALVEAAGERAREVPVPDRAHPPGARARVRRARVAERRQADQGVARRRPAARGGALLLLRGLGRQARVRVPEPAREAARRRGPDHPVELPAADAGVEDRAGARRREHGRAEAGRDDAADRAALLRRRCARPSCRRASSTSSPATAAPAPRSSRPTSTRSRSPARPRSARRSSAGSPAPGRS